MIGLHFRGKVSYIEFQEVIIIRIFVIIHEVLIYADVRKYHLILLIFSEMCKPTVVQNSFVSVI